MDKFDALLGHPWIHTLLGCVALLILAWLCAWLARHVLIRVMTAIGKRTRWQWDDAMVHRGVFLRLAQVIPMLVVDYGLRAVPGVPATVEHVVAKISMALIVLFVVLAINATLSAGEDLFNAGPRGRERTIKGYELIRK